MKRFAHLLGMGQDKPPAGGAVEQGEGAMALTNEELTDIHEVSVQEIIPNPYQPRKLFDDEALRELASSIREFGVIQPLLLRRVATGFELIAGERRLRAAKLVGLEMVPAVVKDFSDKEAAELAMIENLQREDLHYLDEALGFQQLLTSFSLTQEELARRVGKNQSTIANKLRLLKLAPEVRDVLSEQNLTERHARALLKVGDEQQQMAVLRDIQSRNLNVRETEDLVETLVRPVVPAKPKQNIVRVIKDVRIFLNTIQSVVTQMKKAGLKVKMDQTQDDEAIYIQLKVPKRR